MTNYLIILFCLIIGYIIKQRKIVNHDGYKAINAWLIYVGLPALALRYLPDIAWKIDYLYTAILPVLIFGLSYVFFVVVGRAAGFSKRTVLTLTLVSGLNNTSFIGFPLISTYFGDEWLRVGIVSDQVTFFTLSSLGVMLVSNNKGSFEKTSDSIRFILRRIFSFPPLLACLLALVFADYFRAEWSRDFFSKLAATVTPLALFSIGMQLHFQNLSKEFKAITLSLFFKLLLSPVLAIILCLSIGLKGTFYQVSVFEMTMPSLVASSIVIQQFGLNSKLANTIIGISILLGLALSFVWYNTIVSFL